MKKVLLMCTLLFSIVTLAQAQQTEGRKMPSPEERAQRMTAQLEKKLSLTEDQKAKVNAVYMDQVAQMTKLREEAGEDKSGMRAKMVQMSADTDAKIEALLTAEQKTAFTAFKEERKAAAKKRGGAGGKSNDKKSN